MKSSQAVLIILACMFSDAQSLKPSDLTIQEAHSILEAYIPDTTKHLPGYELEDFAGYDPERFYFIEVIWNNPGGSVVWEISQSIRELAIY
jgi:hypothetical protein